MSRIQLHQFVWPVYSAGTLPDVGQGSQTTVNLKCGPLKRRAFRLIISVAIWIENDRSQGLKICRCVEW